jgi:hypothetical protein
MSNRSGGGNGTSFYKVRNNRRWTKNKHKSKSPPQPHRTKAATRRLMQNLSAPRSIG